MRLRGVLVERWPELLLVLVGLFARLAMSAWDSGWSYDYDDHVPLIEWWSRHASWPSIELTRAAYHPPLYYLLAGLMLRAGVAVSSLGTLSIVCGVARLLLFMIALERYLPENRAASRFALALFAVIPAAVHMEGMVTNESLAALWALVALLLVPPLFAAAAPRRWLLAAALGLALGLGFLTKVSALVLVAAIALGALVEWRTWRRKSGPLWVALAVFVAVSSPYVVHNLRTHGKALVSGFDGPDRARVERFGDIPYYRRRPPSYFLAFSPAIFAHPYAPTALKPDARFWPQLVASTFVDYWNFGYAPYPLPGESQDVGNYKPLRHDVLVVSRLSMAGGTLLALVSACALVWALFSSLRRRAGAHLALCLVPLLAVLGQLHFAVQFPNDSEGLVKGAYLQFAAPPLCALFGLAVAWSLRRRATVVVALLSSAALALVGFYTLYCRFI